MKNERERTIDRALAVPVGEESAQLRELFSTDMTLLMKSELTPGLIIPLARAYVIAGITGSKVLKKYCVPGKTKILVKNNEYFGAQGTSDSTNKKAMDVSIDDYVLTYNEETSEKEFKRVQQVHVRDVSSLIEFEFSNGNILECTVEHPIAVLDNCNCLIWRKAQEVLVGNKVKEFSPNRNVEIVLVSGKKEIDYEGKVYDFLVEDNHNFFAEGILVHNCDLILQAQISKDRKGRMELMEALIAGRRTAMDDDDY